MKLYVAKRLSGSLVVLLLTAITWLRSPVPLPDHSQSMAVTPLALPSGCCRVGPFRLDGAWELTSPNDDFGGYSALAVPVSGRLLAFSDRGYSLDFPAPGKLGATRIGAVMPGKLRFKNNRDIESAVWDRRTQRFWIALEGRNGVGRHRADLSREAFRQPPEMRNWPLNSGPEAMVRLADGRFVILGEAYEGRFGGRDHPGLLFEGDPVLDRPARRFTFSGAEGYRPVDLALLPDGRVLMLMRRLVWPVPARFSGKIMLADPAQIQPGGVWRAVELADLAPPLPVDNFEALAIEPAGNGRLTAWLMSDENGAATQRTLLWKLDFSLSDLPK